ncbi:MAG TPA: hypothetical protein VH641_05030 [Streptosporangiaceae bacterium]|jgi:hypothetical protein
MAEMGGGPDKAPETADAVAEQAFVDQAIAAQAAELATEASEAEQPADRHRIREAVGRAAQSGARVTGRGFRAARRGVGFGLGWLTGQVMAMAPRLRVRDQAALQAQFPGKTPEDIADALIEGAARASSAVGGAVGAWASLPVLPAFPVELATETLALIGIEVKLVAELHEAYGVPAKGNVAERMTSYVGAWANRRGVALAPGGLFLAAGSPLARKLRRRVAARAGRTVFALGPLLTGAAAGALLNRRETRRLGQDIRSDLRSRIQSGQLQPGQPGRIQPR